MFMSDSQSLVMYKPVFNAFFFAHYNLPCGLCKSHLCCAYTSFSEATKLTNSLLRLFDIIHCIYLYLSVLEKQAQKLE